MDNNTPLRAIIIDDEKKGINTLKILIEKFIKDVKVVTESTRAEKAIELIEDYKPEIVFLDINMPNMNGFEMLERLQWRNFNLVFITAHHEYALKALKNNAVDYILKPVDHRELQAAIVRIKDRINNNQGGFSRETYAKLMEELNQENKSKIVINSKLGIESIDIKDIVFLESRSNYTYLHLNDLRVISTSKTLKEFENRLCIDELGFMRVHKSFVINLQKIVRYLKTPESIVMTNDYKIPLSRNRKDAFFSWLDI